MHTWRALSLAVFALLLTGCMPRIAPPGPGATTPHLTETSFIASDGLELYMRRWIPAAEPKAVMLAVHGFNDYSKAFDKVPGAPGVGPFLAARGVAVYTYDQRGFGLSPHTGLWAGQDALVNDFADFAAVLKRQHPDIPLYALGESMGGAVVMTALARDNPPPVKAAVLASPAVWARSTMPLLYRVALWLGAHVAPGWTPTGQSLGRQASDNIEMLRDNGRDPLFIKATRIDAVYGLSDLMDAALTSSSEVKAPLLYLYGRNDQIIPRKPTKAALKALTGGDANAVPAFYDNGWHMILRDKDAAVVLNDVASYLSDLKAPLPSGEDRDAIARLEAAKGECPPCK